MPRLDRLILERAANILRDRGTSSRVKISMSSDFLDEAGYEILCDTRIARKRGTVNDEGLNEGERYSISSSEGKAMIASGYGIADKSFREGSRMEFKGE